MKTINNDIYMARVKLFTILGLILSLASVFFAFKDWMPSSTATEMEYTPENRWELPFDLREISGISWLEDGKIAAVQDEDGIIFIYDIEKKKLVREIEFGQHGDYEGIAVKDKDAYVLRSDGTIFEIKDYQDEGRKVTSYRTPFTEENNVETLELDLKGNRLLISPKDQDLQSDRFKGIYAFSLDKKEFNPSPVFKIDMGDETLKRFSNKDLHKTFRPSDLAIHPKTKEIYILDGTKPKLLVMDIEGNLKNVYVLNQKVFPQPEGISFSPTGTLYISSEGKKGSNGTITELELKK